MIKKLILISTLILSTQTFATQSTRDVKNSNSFFSGFENACNHNKQYQDYLEKSCNYKINKKSGSGKCNGGRAWLPGEAVVVDFDLKNLNDHSYISTTIKQNTLFWYGYEVLKIESWHGHGNGINGSAIILKSNNSDVKINMVRNGAKFKKEKNDATDGYNQAEFKKDKNGVKVICDLSD